MREAPPGASRRLCDRPASKGQEGETQCRGVLPVRPSALCADKSRGMEGSVRRPCTLHGAPGSFLPPGFSRLRAKGALKERPYGASRPSFFLRVEVLLKMRFVVQVGVASQREALWRPRSPRRTTKRAPHAPSRAQGARSGATAPRSVSRVRRFVRTAEPNGGSEDCLSERSERVPQLPGPPAEAGAERLAVAPPSPRPPRRWRARGVPRKHGPFTAPLPQVKGPNYSKITYFLKIFLDAPLGRT